MNLSRRVGVAGRFRRVLPAVLCILAIGFLSAQAADPPSSAVVLTSTERQWLREHPVLRLAPDPDFKPIEYFDREGVYRGATADFVGLVERNLGVKITAVHLKNWDEVMEKFRRHEVDLLGAVVRTPNRERFALFTDTLVTVPGGIFTRDPTRKNLTLADLKGRKVAVVSNYTAHDVLKSRYPDLVLDVVPDISTGLAKASLGMVDAYVENMANATYYAQDAGITNLRLAGTTDFDYRWAIGIRKDWPELQGILNKGIAAIGEEERKEAIRRWISIRETGWRPDKTFLFGLVAAVLGILLAASWAWNRRVARDIAERKKTEDALRLSEEKFSKAFRITPDALNINRLRDGMYVEVNEGFCRITGYDTSEVVGKTSLELDLWLRSEDRKELVERLSKEGEVRNYEAKFRMKDGRIVTGLMSARVIDMGGEPCILSITRDITDRARLEEQLRQAQKMESVGRLAGGIAHDFNNLLTVINGYSDILLKRLDAKSTEYREVEEIKRAGERAASLTQQLLAFSRRQVLQPKVLDLNVGVSHIESMLRRLIGEDVELKTLPGAGLWSVKIDPGQVEQVLVNLVVNARDAMPNGGVLTIATSNVLPDDVFLGEHPSAIPGPHVCLSVSDTGTGMSDEAIAHLFEPFFTTKEKGKGTGLGLSTVYGIINQSRGHIDVDSRPGRGTTIRIHLPRVEEKPGIVQEGPEVDLRGGETVLVVEDEDAVREIAKRILAGKGYLVLSARDGNEGIRLFEENRESVALLITDVVMPGMGGRELATRVEALKPGTKVLFMSGYTDAAIDRHGFLEEGLSFLQKPFTYDALLGKVREVLDGTSSV